MQVVVQLFAGARQAAGCESVAVEVSPPVTARRVLDSIRRELPELAPLAASSRLAVGGRYAADDAAIGEDSEIVLIPPVSGG
ncbi:MoaD/ThiS family protein [Candidatus Laterigemmans baculatus]|uniref:MoaD/ThiS family protein n=1 Tax=Candidatus Laterigemmans baculatus TaxID=2770505 RepID=UPI0013DB2751|nr:MoaD/ThiS family protein [Candidatus Laterigemmans baculatus]